MTTKLTPEGAAAKACVATYDAEIWTNAEWNKLAHTAIKSSDEVKRLRLEVRQLTAQRRHDSKELARLRAYYAAVEAALI